MTNNIKAVRERSGKTQRECAECLSITLRAWQGYEQGIREPKYEVLCNIASLFNVSVDYLLGRNTDNLVMAHSDNHQINTIISDLLTRNINSCDIDAITALLSKYKE